MVEDFDELPWIAHGERVQHQAVHHRKDSGIGADAEGEGEDSDDSEGGGFPHYAQTKVQILHKVLNPVQAACIAAFLFGLLDATEVESHATPRFLR